MGDRANVHLITSKKEVEGKTIAQGISIYGHWTGLDLQESILRTTIEDRGNNEVFFDTGYLARAIISKNMELISGMYGFGEEIDSLYHKVFDDNEYPILTIDLEMGNVVYASRKGKGIFYEDSLLLENDPQFSFKFDEELGGYNLVVEES